MIRPFLLLPIFFLHPSTGQTQETTDTGSNIGTKAGRALYHQIPSTSFRCEDRRWAGYYSDPEAQCQVFHICVRRHGTLEQFSFLCPNETVFHQELLVCVWYDSFDCQSASLHYGINENIFEDDDSSVGSRQKALSISRGKSAITADSRTQAKTKSEPISASVMGHLESKATMALSNVNRQSKTIGDTDKIRTSVNEHPETTLKPEIPITNKPSLQQSPILKLIPKVAPSIPKHTSITHNEVFQGRALPQTSIIKESLPKNTIERKFLSQIAEGGRALPQPTVEESALPQAAIDGRLSFQATEVGRAFPQAATEKSLFHTTVDERALPQITSGIKDYALSFTTTPSSTTEFKSNLDFTNNGRFIVRHDNDDAPVGKAVSNPGDQEQKIPELLTQLEDTDFLSRGSFATSILGSEIKSGKTLKTANEDVRGTGVLSRKAVSQIKSSSKQLLTSNKPQQSSIQDKKQIRTTTVTPVPNQKSFTTTATPKSSFAPIPRKLSITTSTRRPIISTQRKTAISDLTAVSPKSNPSQPSKSNNRASSTRASNSFNSRLTSNDVLHDLLKSITIIRAEELLSTKFNKNSRSNVKRKVDNDSAPVSDFSEANSNLDSSPTFTSSRGINRVKAPLHRQEQKKAFNKPTAKARNSAIEHNNRIKLGSVKANKGPNNFLSCLYYYGSKKRPNCNLVNQHAQELHNLGQTDILDSRSKLNKINAQTNENDYSLTLGKVSAKEVTANRQSSSLSNDNFNGVQRLKTSIGDGANYKTNSLTSPYVPIEVNQILNIPSSDFSLPSPSAFIFPNISLPGGEINSNLFTDFTSLTKTAGRPLILIVSSAEAASNEGNQKKVYINTLKSEIAPVDTSNIPPSSNFASSRATSPAQNFYLPSNSLQQSTATKKSTSSSKSYLPSKPQEASSSKTYLPASSPSYISSSKPYIPTTISHIISSKTYLPSTTPKSISSAPTYLPSSRASHTAPSGEDIGLELPAETRDKRDSSLPSPHAILYILRKVNNDSV